MRVPPFAQQARSFPAFCLPWCLPPKIVRASVSPVYKHVFVGGVLMKTYVGMWIGLKPGRAGLRHRVWCQISRTLLNVIAGTRETPTTHGLFPLVEAGKHSEEAAYNNLEHLYRGIFQNLMYSPAPALDQIIQFIWLNYSTPAPVK